MKKIITLIIITLFISCSETEVVKPNNKPHINNKNFIGVVTKDYFEKEHSSWFNQGYENYNTNKKIIEQLKPLLKNVTIKAFMGTWCSDSRREVPIFYKILDEAKFNYKNLQMIVVNRAKKANGLENGYNISHVPTFIFYKNNKEIGRFVEFPTEGSTEKDFLQILSGKSYKHAYQN